MKLSEDQINSLLKSLTDKDEVFSVSLQMVEIIQEEINRKISEEKYTIGKDMMASSFGNMDHSLNSENDNIEMLNIIFVNLQNYIRNILFKS